MLWLLIVCFFSQEAAETDPCQDPDQLRGLDVLEGLNAVIEHIARRGAGEDAVLQCIPTIEALEEKVCSDVASSDFDRAAPHRSARELFEVVGDHDKVDLHCCIEAALRRRHRGSEDSDEQRRKNEYDLEKLEAGANCPRTPICPRDVLAEGFDLRCETVARALRPPAPASSPVRPEPVEPSSPLFGAEVVPGPPGVSVQPPVVRRRIGMLNAGTVLVSFSVASGALSIAAMTLGYGLAGLWKFSEPEERPELDSRGDRWNTVAWASGTASLIGLAAGVPLMICADLRRCQRSLPRWSRRFSIAPNSLNLTMFF